MVGGGFAGLKTVAALTGAPVKVTLVDRRNHHLFQPLLYEVATAALSPGQIAMPLRRIFRKQANATVVLGEITAVDLEEQRVVVAPDPVHYDYLVLATGATHHYFGNEEWATHAPGLKTVDDAVDIRRRFLLAFEKADRCDDAEERRRLMTIVIVGGGPTGIELAGTMSEVARKVLTGEFRDLDPASLRILLVEGADRILPSMAPESSARAKRDLEKLGVEVHLDSRVTRIGADGVELESGDRIAARNLVWAAGVQGAPVEQGLGKFVREDRRVTVEPDLSLAGYPNVFAIGDLAYVPQDGGAVPGLAPAAIQMGDHVGKTIAREVGRAERTDPREAFSYRDKGTLATIGRAKAVAELGRFKFGGIVAWLLWVFIHIFFLVGFRNRFMVLLDWGFAYLTFHRGARLITGDSAITRESRDAAKR